MNYLPQGLNSVAAARDGALATSPKAPDNEGRIRTLIEGQEKIIDALGASLNVLRAKIDYVCFPEPPSAEQVTGDGPVTSALEKQLARNNDILCYLVNRTDSWIRSVRI